MTYPYGNAWVTLGAQNVTTTAAQKVAVGDIQANAGDIQRRLRWIIYTPDGDVYWGGPGVTTATGTPLLSGVPLMVEAMCGLGPHFVAGSNTNIRVTLGFEG